ncbi:unnamed protein product [Nippostrongylus brasiliensis]|uniref:Secreted protein n=1 Tax=Nippostrongylus brasiliensis TaxID=27835 RepID=A0A0N4XS46_NIPBR|nr:unnamed protein product [Nippostrongylus brasiliensis]
MHWPVSKFGRVAIRLFASIKSTTVFTVESMYTKKERASLKRMRFMAIRWQAFGSQLVRRQF